LLADSLRARGRLPEAQQILDSIQDRCQTSAQFHGLQGALQFQRKQHEEALESFRCAYSLDPRSYYLKRQADCLLARDRYSDALGLLLQIEPSERDVYSLGALARAYEGMGASEDAARCYEELLHLAPDNAYSKARLLQLRTAAKHEDDAEKEIDRMLRMSSHREDAALLSVKAEQLKKKGDYRGAADVYLRILGSAPSAQLGFYQRNLAFTYYKGSMYEEAYPLLKSLLEGSPHDVYVRNALVGAACKSGRREELREFLLAMARLSPSNRSLYGIARRLSNKSEKDPE
jgi:tetratricopeptide (TPR) repeat protein